MVYMFSILYGKYENIINEENNKNTRTKVIKEVKYPLYIKLILKVSSRTSVNLFQDFLSASSL